MTDAIAHWNSHGRRQGVVTSRRCALEIGPNLVGGRVCDLEWVTSADAAEAWQVFST